VVTDREETARRTLEAMMKAYEYQSDFARKYVAQGRAEGRAEGRLEGRVEGRVEGRTEEAARALLSVLRARGIPVPDHVRERILAQNEPEQLERWLEKAAVAASVTAILDERH
jgi:predicted transposase YdaD